MTFRDLNLTKCPNCGAPLHLVMTVTSLDQMRTLQYALFWGEKRRGICRFFLPNGDECIHYIVPSSDIYLKKIWPSLRWYYKKFYDFDLVRNKYTNRMVIITDSEF